MKYYTIYIKTFLLQLLLIIATQSAIKSQSLGEVTKGDANFNFEEQNYIVALSQFLKLLKTDKENLDYNYKIGICYLNINGDKSKAIPYLEKCSISDRIFPDLDYYLGQAYMHAGKFEVAINYFNKYLVSNTTLVNPKANETNAMVERYIEMCNNAQQLMQNPINVTFINLGPVINSAKSDYIPFLSSDENTLFFTTNRKYVSDFQEYINQIFFTKVNESGWLNAKSIGSKINTDDHCILMGISRNANYLFIQPYKFGSTTDIKISVRKGNSYKEPENLIGNINSKYDEAGATMTQNEDSIYFASNRPGGLGGYDIYVSKKLPNGQWNTPVNIGEEINTKYDENYPQIRYEKGIKTLYFCSKGHNSMGGYDVFRSEWNNATETWSKPENIGYPLNDTYDNYNITFTKSKRIAYISKYRNDSYGDLDIYKVVFNEEEGAKMIITGIIACGDSLKPIPLKDIDKTISIRVFRKNEDIIYGSYAYNHTNGKYIIVLSPGEYTLYIEGPAYQPYQKEISVPIDLSTITETKQNIYLKKK